MWYFMGQSRVPVKGVGYLRQTDMDTPLYGGVLMSVGYLEVRKGFFRWLLVENLV